MVFFKLTETRTQNDKRILTVVHFESHRVDKIENEISGTQNYAFSTFYLRDLQAKVLHLELHTKIYFPVAQQSYQKTTIYLFFLFYYSIVTCGTFQELYGASKNLRNKSFNIL